MSTLLLLKQKISRLFEARPFSPSRRPSKYKSVTESKMSSELKIKDL